MSDVMEKLVSLCKRKGFIFQSSEIYGGLNGCWDYGPLGVELKRKVKEAKQKIKKLKDVSARKPKATGDFAAFCKEKI